MCSLSKGFLRIPSRIVSVVAPLYKYKIAKFILIIIIKIIIIKVIFNNEDNVLNHKYLSKKWILKEIVKQYKF